MVENLNQISVKFRTFRLDAESTKRKLKEAEGVIEKLKDETNLLRDFEKNLHNQISLAQARLISSKKLLEKSLSIIKQQRRNANKAEAIEHRIEEFEKKINSTRDEFKKFLNSTTKELDLFTEVKKLKTALKIKNNEFDILKMEFQSLSKEKTNMEIEFQTKINHLNAELDTALKKEYNTQARCRDTIVYYKQQIGEYEKKIETYEKERKRFFEDFEVPKSSNCSPNQLAWIDSTVIINSEEKSPKNQLETNANDSEIFRSSMPERKPKIISLKKNKSQNSTQALKHKPQLEFLMASQDSQAVKRELGRKRRLFSTNCNHYED